MAHKKIGIKREKETMNNIQSFTTAMNNIQSFTTASSALRLLRSNIKIDGVRAKALTEIHFAFIGCITTNSPTFGLTGSFKLQVRLVRGGIPIHFAFIGWDQQQTYHCLCSFGSRIYGWNMWCLH